MQHSRHRIYELDALRGIAALSVVLYHYTTRYGELFQRHRDPYPLHVSYGHLGVQLFFIISGFVIYMTLVNARSVAEFAIKRATRLYPAYIVAVILTYELVTMYHLPGRQVSLTTALLNLTMLQGFMNGVRAVDGVYWTLTVELTFYCIIGVLYQLRLLSKIEYLSVLWLLVAAGARIMALYHDTGLLSVIRTTLIADHCNLFIAGMMFYHLKTKAELKYHVIMALCIASQFINPHMVDNVIVASFFAVFYAVAYGKMAFLNVRALSFLGAISYSLYLVHQNLGYIVIDFMQRHGLTNEVFVVVPVMLSILVASGMTFWIERPVQALARKSLLSRFASKGAA